VVKHVYAAELRVVVAAVLAVAADAVLVAKHLLKLGSHLATALARLHVSNLAQKSSLEEGSTREKKSGEERRNVRNSVWQFGTGNKEMQVVRARVSRTGKLSFFFNLSRFGHRTKHAGYGRVQSQNVCFGNVLIAVRQGQRRDAAAAAKEQLVRCAPGHSKYIWLYRYSGKLALAAMCLRRARVVGRSFAAGAPPRRTFVPLAPAAQNLGVGLSRPCRGQACGDMLGAMALIALRPATPRSTTKNVT
jgi:hypothetical protein